MNRYANGARLIGNGAGNGLTNPPSGVSGEFVATTVFKLVDRLHETNVAFLDEVQELQSTVGVFFGNGNHQAQVGLNHLPLGVARAGFTSDHALVNALELGQWNHHLLLQVNELLLQLLHRRNVALKYGAPRFAALDLFFYPLKVKQMLGKGFDELLLRQTAFVDHDAAQLALATAYQAHLVAHHVAQTLNGFRGETNCHELGGDLLLDFVVPRGSKSFAVVGAA